MGSISWCCIVFALAGPVLQDPLCLDGEVDDGGDVHSHGFVLVPGSSLMSYS